MPKAAIADSLSDWEGLLTSASDLPLDDALLGENLEELRTLLERAKELYALRMRLEGERRAAAQALAETSEQAKTIASRIRSKLKGVYGHTSGQLIRFGMKPRPLAAATRRESPGLPRSRKSRSLHPWKGKAPLPNPRPKSPGGVAPFQNFWKNLGGEASPSKISVRVSEGSLPPANFSEKSRGGAPPSQIKSRGNFGGRRPTSRGSPTPIRTAP
jgi:hypothetical protein